MRYMNPIIDSVMKHTKPFLALMFLLLPLGVANGLRAQEQTLTFMSVTDAKFFVYLNGKLQNERSSGRVVIRGLEEKEYHVRIVIDDPFEVAVTRTLKPDSKHNEYTVQFNAVRERVYLKAAKTSREESLWVPSESEASTTVVEEPADEPEHRTPLRRNTFKDSTSRSIVNSIKRPTLDD